MKVRYIGNVIVKGERLSLEVYQCDLCGVQCTISEYPTHWQQITIEELKTGGDSWGPILKDICAGCMQKILLSVANKIEQGEPKTSA